MSKYFTGGRPQGAIGKSHATARNAIVEVFKLKGGVQGLWSWVCKSDENESVFYSALLPKLLPTELAESGLGGDNRIQVVILPPEHSQSQVAPSGVTTDATLPTVKPLEGNYVEQEQGRGMLPKGQGHDEDSEA